MTGLDLFSAPVAPPPASWAIPNDYTGCESYYGYVIATETRGSLGSGYATCYRVFRPGGAMLPEARASRFDARRLIEADILVRS